MATVIKAGCTEAVFMRNYGQTLPKKLSTATSRKANLLNCFRCGIGNMFLPGLLKTIFVVLRTYINTIIPKPVGWGERFKPKYAFPVKKPVIWLGRWGKFTIFLISCPQYRSGEKFYNKFFLSGIKADFKGCICYRLQFTFYDHTQKGS